MSAYLVTSPWLNATTSAQPRFTRAQGIALLEQYVKNINLRRHMLACEAVMGAYATKYGGSVEDWKLVGLLHDFDWEIHPNVEQHPKLGQPILEEQGVPSHIRQAIMAHAPHTGVKPTNDMERCILAVDELTGFIVACALVTPGKRLAEVTTDMIKKKLKQKSFAAKVNRDEIQQGLDLLQLNEDEHYQTVLRTMQEIHDTLGL